MKSMVIQFEEVFDIDKDGIPVVKRLLLVKGFPLAPGARCAPGFKFGGVDMSQHLGQPLVVRDHGTHLEFLSFATFTKDESNQKWVKGWALIRIAPWELFGFYFTKEQAEEDLKKAGEGFEVHYGSKRVGSNNDFIYEKKKA